MMESCPECDCRIYECQDGRWLEWICWKCGYYESDTQAFKSCPTLFKDLVRDNPVKFLKKYAHYTLPTRNQQHFKHSDDSTEPNLFTFLLLLFLLLFSPLTMLINVI